MAKVGPFSLCESVPQHEQTGSRLLVHYLLALEVSEIGGFRRVDVFSTTGSSVAFTLLR